MPTNDRQTEKPTTRKKAAPALKAPAPVVPVPPALFGWLSSQRNLAAHDPTAHELARSIKR
ncbi:MAG: hypothetical protein ACPGVU_21840, partial [Limisphaerales bacterium]